ncbi:uncharacterized protein METZ01_LOCUS434593, partial [marine metagenome]
VPSEQQNQRALQGLTRTSKKRFRFEAENRFCLIGYSSTIIVLTLALMMGLDAFTASELASYAGLTLGYHLLVQGVGMAGLLTTRQSNHAVQRGAMLV